MVNRKWGGLRRSTHRVSMSSLGPILAADYSVLISCWYQCCPHELTLKPLGSRGYQRRKECAKEDLDPEVQDTRFRPAFSSTVPGDYSVNQVVLIGGAQTNGSEHGAQK